MRGAINKVFIAKKILNDILFPKNFIKIMLPSQSVVQFLYKEMVGFDLLQHITFFLFFCCLFSSANCLRVLLFIIQLQRWPR